MLSFRATVLNPVFMFFVSL